MHTLRRIGLIIAVVSGGIVTLGLTSANAASSNISHAYQASSAIPNGSLVSLNPQRSGYIELADSANGQSLLGLVLASSNSLIAVDASANKTQVATNGTASALVSTLNGNISVGDPVGVSAFAGIGMKALPGSNVVGLAQATFNSKSPGAIQRQVKNKTGQSQEIWVGFVPVNIAVGTNTAPAGGAKLNSLQKLVKSLTGRTIPTARIILSLAVAIITLSILVSFIHASIYGGLVSIGRNPLAKHAVFRVLVYITGMAAGTAAIAAVIIFLLLS
jgi:hypothetical protein